jgi:hypothetical protein
MSAVAPINFYSSYGLVPIFAWEAVEPTQDSTTDTPPPPVVCTSTGPDMPAQPTDTDTPSAPQMRLVFKGFEWRAVAEIATFPRPDFMNGLSSGSDDPADPSTKRDDHNRINEAARARKAALVQQPDSASSQEFGPASADNSESE